MTPDAAELLTSRDVAAALEVTPDRVRQLARALGLGYSTAGGRVFSDADLAALRARKTRPEPSRKLGENCENTPPAP